MKARSSSRKARSRKKWTITVHSSFQEADDYDREYWMSRTPAERLREAERRTAAMAKVNLHPDLRRFLRSAICEMVR
jgi:hypothetical protein